MTKRKKMFCGSVCLKHPKYQALRRPRTLCEECWRAWIFSEDCRFAEDTQDPRRPVLRTEPYDRHNDADSCWYG
jgi:hypothetical protein